ncbi:Ltp family lipoprotein [Alkalihalobacterium chitinilyticum]|uniref:Ltp family lipoprotein n=1 Tax=Alkalihalobacterium chitinilyticum TaxID=2980103 RepID=A0ABT5VAP0_9BACI|nr:Ltp family lipoprotein [Alkalihalobacterium chitinilyticum]MDE5412412.1 Ltp family lipoprotein [Alkalihalobacterium chitinilyticum]
MKKILSITLMALLIAVMTACGEAEDQVPAETEEAEELEIDTETTDEEVEVTDEVEEAKEVDEVEPAEQEAADVPREYRNALRAAENYISFMPFSEKGLFQQLSSEYGDQYPEDAAQYAIENIEVDYNEQALKAAINYLDIMPMSDQELFDQLTSEYGDQYTNEQAQYAIDNLPN